MDSTGKNHHLVFGGSIYDSLGIKNRFILNKKATEKWLLVWLAYGVFNPFNSFFYFFLTGSVGYPYAVAISKRITGYGCH